MFFRMDPYCLNDHKKVGNHYTYKDKFSQQARSTTALSSPRSRSRSLSGVIPPKNNGSISPYVCFAVYSPQTQCHFHHISRVVWFSLNDVFYMIFVKIIGKFSSMREMYASVQKCRLVDGRGITLYSL